VNKIVIVVFFVLLNISAYSLEPEHWGFGTGIQLKSYNKLFEESILGLVGMNQAPALNFHANYYRFRGNLLFDEVVFNLLIANNCDLTSTGGWTLGSGYYGYVGVYFDKVSVYTLGSSFRKYMDDKFKNSSFYGGVKGSVVFISCSDKLSWYTGYDIGLECGYSAELVDGFVLEPSISLMLTLLDNACIGSLATGELKAPIVSIDTNFALNAGYYF
jgi:hypothetical protein